MSAEQGGVSSEGFGFLATEYQYTPCWHFLGCRISALRSARQYQDREIVGRETKVSPHKRHIWEVKFFPTGNKFYVPGIPKATLKKQPEG